MPKKLLQEYFQIQNIQRLDESKLKEQEGAISGWTAPIWDIGKLNLNGRVYGEDLAKRIVKENKATLAYDSHVDDYREAYKNAVAVIKNPRIEGDQLWVDIFFVDEGYAKKLASIHKEGVGIGVSSVGYGETDKDGVVNPTTYELVRYLDFVVTPANSSYAQPNKKDGESDKEEDSIEVSVDEDSELSDDLKARIEVYKKIENMENNNEKI